MDTREIEQFALSFHNCYVRTCERLADCIGFPRPSQSLWDLPKAPTFKAYKYLPQHRMLSYFYSDKVDALGECTVELQWPEDPRIDTGYLWDLVAHRSNLAAYYVHVSITLEKKRTFELHYNLDKVKWQDAVGRDAGHQMGEQLALGDSAFPDQDILRATAQIALVPEGNEWRIAVIGLSPKARLLLPGIDRSVPVKGIYVASRDSIVYPEEFEELRGLALDPSTKEADIQHFFELHPKFLLGGRYSGIRPQFVLQHEDGGKLIPDFFLKPIGSEWWDILDLKLPKVPLFVGRRGRMRLSAEVRRSIAQMLEYREFFEDYRNREVIAASGIQCFRPSLILLIGMDHEGIDPLDVRRVLDRETTVSVKTYRELLAEAAARQYRRVGGRARSF